MELTDVANLLKKTLRRPIAYHRIFTEITGSVTAGLMLSQAWYWSPKTEDQDGWFYKTEGEWFEETGMTRSEQKTARQRLVKAGLIEERRCGMPAKMYYRINTEVLISQLAGITPTERRRKSSRQVGRDHASKMVETTPTVLIPESTPESTLRVPVEKRPKPRRFEPQIEAPFQGEPFLQALATYRATRKAAHRPLIVQSELLLYEDLREWGEQDSTFALLAAAKAGHLQVLRPDTYRNGHKGNGNGSYQKRHSEPETASGDSFDFVPKSVIR
jgi:hypothetical protein